MPSAVTRNKIVALTGQEPNQNDKILLQGCGEKEVTLTCIPNTFFWYLVVVEGQQGEVEMQPRQNITVRCEENNEWKLQNDFMVDEQRTEYFPGCSSGKTHIAHGSKVSEFLVMIEIDKIYKA